jgi:hypothetical protein
MKTTLRKNSKESKMKLQTMLRVDDFDFIIAAVSDTSEDILQRTKEKQETMYDKIETELRGVQQDLQSSRTMSTVSTSDETELGYEPTQLHIIADATKAHLRCVHEEKEEATMTLKKAQEGVIEQHKVAQQEKFSLQTKFKEDRAQIQHEKEQLLAKQLE